MNYLNKFTTYILFFFIILNFSASAENISFINVDYLVQNSNIGKKILRNIDNQNKKNIDELEKKNKELVNLENSIKNKKNVISNEDYNIEVKNFQKKFNLFTNEKNEMVKNFDKYKKTELGNLFKLFNPIIRNYLEKNQISILLDSKNIFMGNSELNITENVLKIINDEIK